MKRINVVGTSGSGKSTFGRQLSQQICAPYIEMDALFWQPNWKKHRMQSSSFALNRR